MSRVPRCFFTSVATGLLLAASLAYAVPAGAGSAPWLRPKADYMARTVMEADGEKITGRVWASGAKERRELVVSGRRHTVIVRKDRGVTWILMPQQRMYLEQSLGDGGLVRDRFEGGELAREAQSREAVHGASATRYRVHGTTSEGEAFEALMWMTEQEIPVRVVTGEGRSRVHMELRDLSVGAIDARRFEVPRGFTRFELPAAAKADLEALRERKPR